MLDEESRNRSDSSQYLWRLSYAGLWPTSRLVCGFFGNDKTIQSITLADISDFYERYYQPEKRRFCRVRRGKKSEQGYIITTLNAFSWGKKTSAAKFPKEKFFDTKTVIIEPRKDDDRFWVSVGWGWTIPDSEGKSEVIGEAVGGLFASDGFLLVKPAAYQENITYWVESDFANFSETGYMRFFFRLKKDVWKKVFSCGFSKK